MEEGGRRGGGTGLFAAAQGCGGLRGPGAVGCGRGRGSETARSGTWRQCGEGRGRSGRQGSMRNRRETEGRRDEYLVFPAFLG